MAEQAVGTVQVDNERVKVRSGASCRARKPGTIGNVINANPYPFRFIEIEIK